MIFGNYNEEYKHCIFKCKNGVHFFRIPNCPKTRKIWMDNLGLKSINVNSRVCNNHFTDQMFTTSGKRLKSTAIPNKNLPSLNGDIELGNQTSGQLDSRIGHLLYDKEDEDPSYKVKPDVVPLEPPQLNSSLKKTVGNNDLKNFPHEINIPAGTQEFLGDGSKLLLNYQLRNQGKHVCNVMELPEFILVFTAFRAKDTFIIPPNDLMPEYIQNHESNAEETPEVVKTINTRKTSRSRRNLKKKESPKKDEPIGFEHPARVIKYVPYAPQRNVVQREREIQADASSQIITTESGVQCNIDEESGAGKDDSSELEWINHIIQAHVFNAEGDMYECHICGEIAATYASKLQHLMVHKESSSLCSQCGRLFTSYLKLKNHEKKEHLEKKFEIKKALRCPKFHCTKAFHSRRQLFDHIDQHTKKTEKKCSKCQRCFSSSIQLHCHKSRRICWR